MIHNLKNVLVVALKNFERFFLNWAKLFDYDWCVHLHTLWCLVNSPPPKKKKWPFLWFSHLWRTVNSSENKNSKIYPDNVYVFLRPTFMQIFKICGQKVKKLNGFKGRFFSKSWSKPCIFANFLPQFLLWRPTFKSL